MSASAALNRMRKQLHSELNEKYIGNTQTNKLMDLKVTRSSRYSISPPSIKIKRCAASKSCSPKKSRGKRTLNMSGDLLIEHQNKRHSIASASEFKENVEFNSIQIGTELENDKINKDENSLKSEIFLEIPNMKQESVEQSIIKMENDHMEVDLNSNSTIDIDKNNISTPITNAEKPEIEENLTFLEMPNKKEDRKIEFVAQPIKMENDHMEIDINSNSTIDISSEFTVEDKTQITTLITNMEEPEIDAKATQENLLILEDPKVESKTEEDHSARNEVIQISSEGDNLNNNFLSDVKDWNFIEDKVTRKLSNDSNPKSDISEHHEFDTVSNDGNYAAKPSTDSNEKFDENASISSVDSAKGSSIGVGEIPIKEEDLKHMTVQDGEVVWGCVNSFKYWPCLIYSSSGENNKVLVKFFNDKGRWSWLNPNYILDYDGPENLIPAIEKKFGSKVPKSKLRTMARIKTVGYYMAIHEADFFKNIPIHDRINTYEDCFRQANGIELDTKMILKTEKMKREANGARSPTPESPSFELLSPLKNENVEVYKEYVAHMEKFQASRKSNAKPKEPISRKRKLSADVPVVPVSDGKKRISLRMEARKEKAELAKVFEPIIKVEEVPVKSPPKKKPRINSHHLETLEELFITPMTDNRFLFRRATKNELCRCCFKTGELVKCAGKCEEYYHLNCLFGAGDENAELPQIKTEEPTCVDCIYNVTRCFVCKQKCTEPEEIQNMKKCMQSGCGLQYHEKCLTRWPKLSLKKKFICPQHQCHSCSARTTLNKQNFVKPGHVVKCMLCPASYHQEWCCTPAGSEILSQNCIICPRHVMKNGRGVKAKKLNVNITWCLECSFGGDLICCEGCPGAIHPSCLDEPEMANVDDYYCEDCKAGRISLYNSMGWAKIGNYRFWPCIIMHESVIPEVTLKKKQYSNQICVRFMGTYDYAWITYEKIIPYSKDNAEILATGSGNIKQAFAKALDEARQVFPNVERQFYDCLIKNTRPPPYVRLLNNCEVPPVKMEFVDHENTQKCDCSPLDPEPCGYNSDCVNRLLHIECNKLVCSVGDNCRNRTIQKHQYKNAEIVYTGERGWGLLAKEDIPQGHFVIEYVGELITNREMERRMTEKYKNHENNFYFLQLSSTVFIDAERKGNLARFINHSCDPNLKTLKIDVNGYIKAGLFAVKDIKSGTELTFDYDLMCKGEEKRPCHCGAAKCSGFIGEKLRPVKLKQEKIDVNKKKQPKKRKRIVKQIKTEPIDVDQELPVEQIKEEPTSVPVVIPQDFLEVKIKEELIEEALELIPEVTIKEELIENAIIVEQFQEATEN